MPDKVLISINVSNMFYLHEQYVIYCKYLCNQNKQD